MKTKLDIQKILHSRKSTQKSNGSFDKALMGLGIKFTKSDKSEK